MAWNNSVITNAGLELLEQSLSGDGIVISRAALGGGTVDVSALVDQTVLTDPLVGTMWLYLHKSLFRGLLEGR